MSQKVSVRGVLDGISAQNTVLKSVCDSVAFLPAAGWLGIFGIMYRMPGVFSFQWPSRADDQEAESEDLEFVIDLLVNPGNLWFCSTCLFVN